MARATWSYLARDFVVCVVHVALKQVMKAAENQKRPIAVTHLQHEYNVTNEMDQELQHFLKSRTEGENQVWNNGEDWLLSMTHQQLGGVWTTAGKSCLRRGLPKIDDLAHTIQAWEILEQRHRERTGDQLPEDMRLAVLLSLCPTDLEKELTTQQHLFPDYAQMKAHVVTVINSRARGVPPMMVRTLSNEDSYLHAGSDESVESEDGERQESLH